MAQKAVEKDTISTCASHLKRCQARLHLARIHAAWCIHCLPFFKPELDSCKLDSCKGSF